MPYVHLPGKAGQGNRAGTTYRRYRRSDGRASEPRSLVVVVIVGVRGVDVGLNIGEAGAF